MPDFDPTPADRAIIEEAHRQAEVGRRYARHFDRHENELPPDQLPEAKDHPDLAELMRKRANELSGPRMVEALVYLEQWWGGVPLRDGKYSLGNHVLEQVGTPEQIAKWRDLPTIAIAMTEPIGGSDPSAIRTTAVHDPASSAWILNGEKIFITYSATCQAVIVLARAVEPGKPPRLSTFMVEKGTPGFTVGPQLRKLGLRSEDTATLAFVGCRIPAFNHIDGGLRQTLTAFNESRPMVSAFALGVTRAALDFTRQALAEAGVTIDYNSPPARQSAAAEKLLLLEAEWEATWLTVMRAKWIEDTKAPAKIEASLAKSKAGRMARRVTQGCIELLGPAALSETHLLEKWFRDARIFDIYEGTGEIQRLIIARHLLGYSPKELN